MAAAANARLHASQHARQAARWVIKAARTKKTSDNGRVVLFLEHYME